VGEDEIRRAPTDYDAMKEDLAWRMVRGLEKRIPGLSKHIVYYSLGTPLTNEHYLNATRGNLYGIDKRPSQVGPWPSRRAPSSTACTCAGKARSAMAWQASPLRGSVRRRPCSNCRSSDILTQKGPGPMFLQAEEPGTWPEHLKKKMERGEKAFSKSRNSWEKPEIRGAGVRPHP
jgi:all-trans-retinol 13,14-reductase